MPTLVNTSDRAISKQNDGCRGSLRRDELSITTFASENDRQVTPGQVARCSALHIHPGCLCRRDGAGDAQDRGVAAMYENTK
eukprot:6208115-Pleurochrysis_carterae.AAC.4